MTQQSLFDSPFLPPIARKADPVSSKIAAHEITECGKRQKQLNAVLMLVRDYPGRTSRELAELSFEMDRYLTARRLPELEKLGLVRRSGVKGRRKECKWEAV